MCFTQVNTLILVILLARKGAHLLWFVVVFACSLILVVVYFALNKIQFQKLLNYNFKKSFLSFEHIIFNARQIYSNFDDGDLASPHSHMNEVCKKHSDVCMLYYNR